MPISGRFRITSIALPTHIEAIRPQNSCGLLVITCGPGWMPLIVIAPTISAITAFGGMPSVSIGMNEVCAPALLADLGAGDALDRALAERDCADCAPSSSRPCRTANDASSAPPPGSTPRIEPSAVPRSTDGQASLKSRLVGHRPFTSLVKTSRCSAGWPRLAMISPKPNTPIAMTTKPMPSVSCGMSKL